MKSMFLQIPSRGHLPLHPSLRLNSLWQCNPNPVCAVRSLPLSRPYYLATNDVSKPSHSSIDSSLLGGGAHLKLFQIKDAFVRDLLCRFLTNLWGSRTTLCFFRNTQRSLSAQECVLVRVQQHRVFCLSPAPIHTPRQREKYP